MAAVIQVYEGDGVEHNVGFLIDMAKAARAAITFASPAEVEVLRLAYHRSFGYTPVGDMLKMWTDRPALLKALTAEAGLASAENLLAEVRKLIRKNNGYKGSLRKEDCDNVKLFAFRVIASYREWRGLMTQLGGLTSP